MKTYEYKNDYFYFVVRPEKSGDKDVLAYYSGVNVTRFMPMMKGRLGLGSNPIVSGLQLIKYDLCTLAHSRGARPRKHRGTTASAGITTASEGWFTEALVIENYGDLMPEEIVLFAVKSMLRRINSTSLSENKVSDSLPPAEMQKQLEPLCMAA